MDYKWSGSRLTVQDRRHFEACLQLNGFSDDLFESVRSNMSGSDPAALSSKRQDQELRGSALPFEIIMIESQKGRVFGSTSGGLFGSFPSTAMAGDVVVVLFGGRAPFVLRPLGAGMFELVGACYLHGIMNGEWVTAVLRSGQLELFREFVVQ
jgi:hypothetical protein